MATSTIPAVMDALLAKLRAAAAAQRAIDGRNITVVDGFPRFDIADDDLIVLGGLPDPVADGQQVPAALGGRRRKETYSLDLHVSSSRGGDDQKAVRDRAFLLVGLVEQLVRDDITLGLGPAVEQVEVSGSFSVQQSSADDAHLGVLAQVNFQLAVQARI